jgi:predicted nucleic acid-binding Zn finger protein
MRNCFTKGRLWGVYILAASAGYLSCPFFIVLLNLHARYICYNPTWVICAWSYRLRKKNVNFSQFVLHVSEQYKHIVFFLNDCLQK